MCNGCDVIGQRRISRVFEFPKQKIHIISSQPIRRRSSANYFHELSMNSVSIDVIGEFWFWGAMKREFALINLEFYQISAIMEFQNLKLADSCVQFECVNLLKMTLVFTL